MIRSIEHQRGPRIVYKGKQFRRTSILMLFLPILGPKWIKKYRIWFLWNHRTLKFYSMMISVKYGIHYSKNGKKGANSKFQERPKVFDSLQLSISKCQLFTKSHWDIAWNDWKPKRNQKSIHRQIQAASLHFALFLLFLGQKWIKKGPDLVYLESLEPELMS